MPLQPGLEVQATILRRDEKVFLKNSALKHPIFEKCLFLNYNISKLLKKIPPRTANFSKISFQRFETNVEISFRKFRAKTQKKAQMTGNFFGLFFGKFVNWLK
ncbi:hypothetical protein OA84_09240 [Kaistella solincola]|uniref:Ribosomal protein S1 n=1 Tax=Kaistella solincola TaxID=510955 RepID=A0ABR4ZQP5_9FLAO|nr:hypothetical protein OA84_09240 [Kaistella solincola]